MRDPVLATLVACLVYLLPSVCQSYSLPSQEHKLECFMAASEGSCTEYHERWYYNPKSGSCHQFMYKGCEGNKNNFFNEDDCLRHCATAPMPGDADPKPDTDAKAHLEKIVDKDLPMPEVTPESPTSNDDNTEAARPGSSASEPEPEVGAGETDDEEEENSMLDVEEEEQEKDKEDSKEPESNTTGDLGDNVQKPEEDVKTENDGILADQDQMFEADTLSESDRSDLEGVMSNLKVYEMKPEEKSEADTEVEITEADDAATLQKENDAILEDSNQAFVSDGLSEEDRSNLEDLMSKMKVYEMKEKEETKSGETETTDNKETENVDMKQENDDILADNDQAFQSEALSEKDKSNLEDLMSKMKVYEMKEKEETKSGKTETTDNKETENVDMKQENDDILADNDQAFQSGELSEEDRSNLEDLMSKMKVYEMKAKEETQSDETKTSEDKKTEDVEFKKENDDILGDKDQAFQSGELSEEDLSNLEDLMSQMKVYEMKAKEEEETDEKESTPNKVAEEGDMKQENYDILADKDQAFQSEGLSEEDKSNLEDLMSKMKVYEMKEKEETKSGETETTDNEETEDVDLQKETYDILADKNQAFQSGRLSEEDRDNLEDLMSKMKVYEMKAKEEEETDEKETNENKEAEEGDMKQENDDILADKDQAFQSGELSEEDRSNLEDLMSKMKVYEMKAKEESDSEELESTENKKMENVDMKQENDYILEDTDQAFQSGELSVEDRSNLEDLMSRMKVYEMKAKEETGNGESGSTKRMETGEQDMKKENDDILADKNQSFQSEGLTDEDLANLEDLMSKMKVYEMKAKEVEEANEKESTKNKEAEEGDMKQENDDILADKDQAFQSGGLSEEDRANLEALMSTMKVYEMKAKEVEEANEKESTENKEAEEGDMKQENDDILADKDQTFQSGRLSEEDRANLEDLMSKMKVYEMKAKEEKETEEKKSSENKETEDVDMKQENDHILMDRDQAFQSVGLSEEDKSNLEDLMSKMKVYEMKVKEEKDTTDNAETDSNDKILEDNDQAFNSGGLSESDRSDLEKLMSEMDIFEMKAKESETASSDVEKEKSNEDIVKEAESEGILAQNLLARKARAELESIMSNLDIYKFAPQESPGDNEHKPMQFSNDKLREIENAMRAATSTQERELKKYDLNNANMEDILQEVKGEGFFNEAILSPRDKLVLDEVMANGMGVYGLEEHLDSRQMPEMNRDRDMHRGFAWRNNNMRNFRRNMNAKPGVNHVNVHKAPPMCFFGKDTGPCKGKELKWYFDSGKKMCLPFYYGGCLGNANRFGTRDECNQRCCRGHTTVSWADEKTRLAAPVLNRPVNPPIFRQPVIPFQPREGPHMMPNRPHHIPQNRMEIRRPPVPQQQQQHPPQQQQQFPQQFPRQQFPQLQQQHQFQFPQPQFQFNTQMSRGSNMRPAPFMPRQAPQTPVQRPIMPPQQQQQPNHPSIQMPQRPAQPPPQLQTIQIKPPPVLARRPMPENPSNIPPQPSVRIMLIRPPKQQPQILSPSVRKDTSLAYEHTDNRYQSHSNPKNGLTLMQFFVNKHPVEPENQPEPSFRGFHGKHMRPHMGMGGGYRSGYRPHMRPQMEDRQEERVSEQVENKEQQQQQEEPNEQHQQETNYHKRQHNYYQFPPPPPPPHHMFPHAPPPYPWHPPMPYHAIPFRTSQTHSYIQNPWWKPNRMTTQSSYPDIDPYTTPPGYTQKTTTVSPVTVYEAAEPDENAPSYSCFLKVEPGFCKAYLLRWFYDKAKKSCESFYYGGCGGNANNFASADECRNTCLAATFGDESTTLYPDGIDVFTSPQYVPDEEVEKEMEEEIKEEIREQVVMEEEKQVMEEVEEKQVEEALDEYVKEEEEMAEGENTEATEEEIVDVRVGENTEYIIIVVVMCVVGIGIIILVAVSIIHLRRKLRDSKKDKVLEAVLRSHVYGEIPRLVYAATHGSPHHSHPPPPSPPPSSISGDSVSKAALEAEHKAYEARAYQDDEQTV